MNRSLARLDVPLLFGNVLSGQFLPPSDPEARLHSLGLLAASTYQKGELVGEGMNNEQFHYSPSWSPNVRTTVTVTYDSTRLASHILLRRLELEGPHSSPLTLSIQVQNDEAFLNASAQGLALTQKLETGDQINDIRDTVTMAAQAFFGAHP